MVGTGYGFGRVGGGGGRLGNPLIGFPSARQPTGLSGLPFLIFWDQ